MGKNSDLKHFHLYVSNCTLMFLLLSNLQITDTLTIDYESGGSLQTVGLIKTDIAWTTDKRSKYGNPKGFDTNMKGGNIDQ